MTDLDRRSFLRTTAAAAGGAALSSTLVWNLTGAAGSPDRSAPAQRRSRRRSYGPLQPVVPTNEPGGPAYLALPAGFSYVVFAKTGAPMVGGGGVHGQNHDGMAAFALPDGRVRLTRNQEDRNDPGAGSVGGPTATRYDTLGGGGVEVLDFDVEDRALVNSFVGLNGTIVNCAGGAAYRKSGWLTCEETIDGPADGWGQKHGYVFLLPVGATGTVDAEPLVGLGRRAHEALVVGGRTGTVYLTEDGGSGRGSGLYRFKPQDPTDLTKGGRLQMFAVRNRPQADLREGQKVGRTIRGRWVDIDDPDPDPVVQVEEPGANSNFAQGWAEGGALFNRLEGCWPGREGFFFVSTSGGDAKNGDVNDDGYEEGYGQIWHYRGDDRLELAYESPGGSVLDSPDNITVSPRGGLLVCEDDAGSADGDTHPLAPGITDVNRLIGVDRDGDAFEFAVNRSSDSEWAGACFSPDGRTLFANIFGDETAGSGFTCAITGPWEDGAL